MKCVDYKKDFFSEEESETILAELAELDYTSNLKTIDGEDRTIPRMMGYFSEDGVDYPYAGLVLTGSVWTDKLKEVRDKLEEETGRKFNGVLINVYRDGMDTIGWHTDSETQLGKDPYIATLSFGSERRFCFREIDNRTNKKELVVGSGSLLAMKDDCQRVWEHKIPRDTAVKATRYSLTFRNCDYGN